MTTAKTRNIVAALRAEDEDFEWYPTTSDMAQVIIEDYVHHEATKLVAVMLVKFAAIALGLACAMAVLKVALGS